MGFGIVLKELRKRAGLTRAQLVEAAGGNEEHLAKVESETRKPPRRNRLMSWATVLVLSIQASEHIDQEQGLELVQRLFNEAGYVLTPAEVDYVCLLTGPSAMENTLQEAVLRSEVRLLKPPEEAKPGQTLHQLSPLMRRFFATYEDNSLGHQYKQLIEVVLERILDWIDQNGRS